MINLDVPIPKTTQPKGHKLRKICVESSQLTKIKSQIFICAERTNPKFSLKIIGLEFWENLNKQVDKLKSGQHQYSTFCPMEIHDAKWLEVIYGDLSKIT